MKRDAFVYIPKSVYSEFDAIAPLILLSRQNNKIYTFVSAIK